MPSVSKKQQKIFGLALSVKRGETPRSEASDDVLKIVDSMTEKEIEDFAGTEHKGLPTKVEIQVREMVREELDERFRFGEKKYTVHYTGNKARGSDRGFIHYDIEANSFKEAIETFMRWYYLPKSELKNIKIKQQPNTFQAMYGLGKKKMAFQSPQEFGVTENRKFNMKKSELRKLIREVIKESNDKVIADVIALSSGTMAKLTGKRDYKSIDKIQSDWANWLDNQSKVYSNWREAWEDYSKTMK